MPVKYHEIKNELGVGIKISIHKTHRQFTSGLDIIEVDGNNVGACLDNPNGLFPDIKKVWFDKKGQIDECD